MPVAAIVLHFTCQGELLMEFTVQLRGTLLELATESPGYTVAYKTGGRGFEPR
jgi:hypothetical protein